MDEVNHSSRTFVLNCPCPPHRQAWFSGAEVLEANHDIFLQYHLVVWLTILSFKLIKIRLVHYYCRFVASSWLEYLLSMLSLTSVNRIMRCHVVIATLCSSVCDVIISLGDYTSYCFWKLFMTDLILTLYSKWKCHICFCCFLYWFTDSVSIFMFLTLPSFA